MPLLTPFVALLALQGGWKMYTLGPGLRVDLPTPPVKQPFDREDPTSTNWTSMHQDQNVIVVGFSRFKDDSTPPDQILSGAIYGAMSAFEGKITLQKDLMLAGWPGVEYRLANSEGLHGICRQYVVQDGMVTMYVASSFPKALDAPATKLFSSLKLHSGAGQGTFKVAGPEFKPFPVGETGVTVDLPSVPKQEKFDAPGIHKRTLYRYKSDFVNRNYVVGYIEIEEDELGTMDQEAIDDLLMTTHTVVASGLKTQVGRPVPVKLAGRNAFRTNFPIVKGVTQARLETTLVGRRVFIFLAATPTWLSKSPEIEKFFGSIKVE